MRIAVSGTHRTGKTTLLHDLAESLPGYEFVEEPYHQLETEGYVFADPPTVEDFERQLLCSIETVLASPEDSLIDRCPLDLLAYLVRHDDAAEFDPEPWLPQVHEAMALLDLVVFVPIEDPDRMAGADLETLRQGVNEELRESVLADSWGVGVEAVEVMGAPGERVGQVLGHLEEIHA